MKDVIIAISPPGQNNAVWTEESSTYQKYPEMVTEELKDVVYLNTLIEVESSDVIIRQNQLKQHEEDKDQSKNQDSSTLKENHENDGMAKSNAIAETKEELPNGTPNSTRPTSTSISNANALNQTNANSSTLSRNVSSMQQQQQQQQQQQNTSNISINCPNCSTLLLCSPNQRSFNCSYCNYFIQLGYIYYYQCPKCKITYQHNQLCTLRCPKCLEILVNIKHPYHVCSTKIIK